MAVTIKDVAKAAGVAPSTVSRVIADNSRISLDTKKRVRKAMKDLGYHPNINARNLVARSTQAIGVVMPSSTDKALQNPFFPEVLRGIGSVAHDLEYSLYVSTGGTEEEQFEEVKRMVFGHRVDGIILLYSRENDAVTEFLYEKKFPFVIVGKPPMNESEITYVDNDNVKASREITEYLIGLGHKHIGFIGGPTDLVVTVDRYKGYQEALKKAALPVRDDYRVQTEFLKSGGRKAVEELFSLEEPPTGLVIADDLISLGVITMLEEFGLSVPDDVSIVSFNNVYLSEITNPSLTTVDIQIYMLGVHASKCLIEKARNKEEPAKRIIVPHKIKNRQSTRDTGLK
ncbi:LacI family DNA-binding transcriptional regulator [Aquibacillus koreensis]|uniref:LacI family DNA-binding transcriptional regulator n=1 Tax=Aquibacillus koreensis TaxID=279446 RepID=A0A9X3WPL6_9BACI|nr:LacI family DNA-binding transcriptional regulator [Aquibacillus koreensis]MCT2536987.1 LacI family DNA-binding transcriptional regulator [Aquibacillus koreensis]MDC3422820.1 LacI family DNA-binding transcriptional regulator [Aquibacillus koreensis]